METTNGPSFLLVGEAVVSPQGFWCIKIKFKKIEYFSTYMPIHNLFQLWQQ